MQAITYEPLCGTHIRAAVTEARRLVLKNQTPVRFRFNDVLLVATRKTSVASLLWTFDLVASQHAQSYRRSKRYRDAAKRRRENLAKDQWTVDHLLRTLDASIANGLDDTVLWLSRFSEVAGDRGLVYSKAEVSQTLKSAGYAKNQHVELPQEAFKNRKILGEYIVGQAINCLDQNLPLHRVTSEFAAEYASLTD